MEMSRVVDSIRNADAARAAGAEPLSAMPPHHYYFVLGFDAS